MLTIKRGSAMALGFLLLGSALTAQAETGIDQRIDQAVRPFADTVSGFIFSSFTLAGVGVPYVLVWLLLAALVFT